MFKIQDHRCLPSIPTKTKSFSEKSASRFQSMSFSTTRSTLTNLTTATPPPVVVGLSTSAISSVANSRSSQPSVLTPTRPSNHSNNTRSRGRGTGGMWTTCWRGLVLSPYKFQTMTRIKLISLISIIRLQPAQMMMLQIWYQRLVNPYHNYPHQFWLCGIDSLTVVTGSRIVS